MKRCVGKGMSLNVFAFFTVSLLKGTHNCNSFSFGFEWIFLLADKAARPPPVAPLRGGVQPLLAAFLLICIPELESYWDS